MRRLSGLGGPNTRAAKRTKREVKRRVNPFTGDLLLLGGSIIGRSISTGGGLLRLGILGAYLRAVLQPALCSALIAA
jgi:hypothetical protein